MKREAALEVVAKMGKWYLDAPHPGNSPESIQFFEQHAQQLRLGVRFNLEIEPMLGWVRIFYSTRKWERWGHDHIRTMLYEAICRVRERVQMAPDERFQ